MLIPERFYIDLAIDRNPLILTAEHSVQDALKCMNQAFNSQKLNASDRLFRLSRAGCIFIYDRKQIIGLLTQWDILHLVETQVNLGNLKLSEAAIPLAKIVKRAEIQDLNTLLNLLINSHSIYLPIVDESEKIIGFTTQEHILAAEKQRSEDNLKQTELNRQRILTAMPELMYRVSAEGIYLEHFSSSYVNDLFIKETNPIGKHLSEVLPESLAQRKLQAIQKVISTGEVEFFEQQWQVNNKIQYEELQVVKINEQEVLTIIRDISDRKQAEAALRESELRFRSVFDNAAVSISLTSPNGEHIAVNQSFCNMLGYSQEEIKLLKFQEITHPDDLELDLSNHQKLLNNEIDSFHIEKRFLCRNGQFIWTLMSVSLVRDAHNQPLYDIALIQNINELKATQQELQKLNQELEVRIQQRTAALVESETRKQQILNAIPDLLLRLKPDGTCIDCILPTVPDKEAFLPVRSHISEVLPANSIKNLVKVFNQAIATGEVQFYEHKVKKYNVWVHEEVRVSPCGKDEILVLVRNISARKQAEEDLKLSNEKLKATNKELERLTRLKDEFLATMSHELRTPLNVILGISEGLQEQAFGTLNQRQQNSLATIQRSGKHLLEVINDILDVAKIESGKFTLDITNTSVKYLCESSLSFVKYQATQKNIQLNLIIHPQVPQDISIDERRIRQLLINLLNNAVKFTPKNGKVSLEVLFTESHSLLMNNQQDPNLHEICFKVSDTGIGIAAEDIGKLFQPFVQINSSLSRQYTGTGLGLNLVKKLAALHGGTVSVESIVGKGSCFAVHLPYAIFDNNAQQCKEPFI